MKRFLFLFPLFFIAFALSAQNEIISVATDLIVAKKYRAANYFLDSVLKKNRTNVDALMMKGNVILNRAVENLPAENTLTRNDESIFSPSAEVKDKKIIPLDTVRLIEKLWRKCLNIDTSRNDIRKGLCTIYAMALMKDSLKMEIRSIVNRELNADAEQPYRLTEYARKFKERNRFDDAMDIYQFIASLYPEVAGLRCDIAGEYFNEGKMNEALTWLDSTFQLKKVDETSFLNGAFIYSELGYFGDAQNVLNSYSGIYQRKADLFYYGLSLFADSSAKYFEVLDTFVQIADTNSYSTEVYLARKLLAHRDSFELENYRLLVADKEIPDYYKVLLHARALRQFAHNCEPFVVYGVFQAYIKNYPAAIQYLEEGENCDLSSALKEYWLLVYAYTLFHTDKQKSLPYFQQLYNSATPFYQQAAKYFSVPILIDQKKGNDAEKLLQEIIKAQEKTKYGEILSRMIPGIR